MQEPSLIKNECLNHRNKQISPPEKKQTKKHLIAFSACTWRSYRLLWRAAWRPPPPSPRSCPPRQRWRRRSSRGPGWCPPWPEPGRSLVVPPARRSHSACRHSAPGPLTHNWSVGSRGQRRGWVAGEGEQRRAWTKEMLTFASALACVQREKVVAMVTAGIIIWMRRCVRNHPHLQ